VNFAGLWSLLVLGVAAMLGCARAPSPNLLLITIDTLRADRLACYGGAADAGLAICALGARGTRYVWAISPASQTSPAIASILTSRYPSFHGVKQAVTTTLLEDEQTLPELLEASGFDTAAVVSNPVLATGRGFEQGFHVYNDEMKQPERNRSDRVERVASDTTDAALAWIAQAREPWFLWVHYQDTHGPYDPPGAPPARDVPGSPELPLLHDHSGRGGIPVYQELQGVRRVATYEARYRAELDYVDRKVSRLLRALDATGRPVGILLTADHGEAFGEDDYWFAHGHSVALDQIRVPLLWRPPVGAAASITMPVSTLDVAPTLLAMAGLPAPEGFQGRSLALAEPGGAARERVIFAEHAQRVALVAGRRYFARDRSPITNPLPDPNSAGQLHGLPPRLALLGPDGNTPLYETAEVAGVEAFERAFSQLLAAARTPAAAPARVVSAARREQLEALGYLQEAGVEGSLRESGDPNERTAP